MRFKNIEDKTAIRFLTYWVLGVFLSLMISMLRNGAWAGWWIQVGFVLLVFACAAGIYWRSTTGQERWRDLIRKVTDPFYY